MLGSGVRDFFYEPIQGAVHGPVAIAMRHVFQQFIEGLEAGTQSLGKYCRLPDGHCCQLASLGMI